MVCAGFNSSSTVFVYLLFIYYLFIYFCFLYVLCQYLRLCIHDWYDDTDVFILCYPWPNFIPPNKIFSKQPGYYSQYGD
jgi:hypothetical protein